MKNFILLLLTFLSLPTPAQDKLTSTDLAYPDLIPTLMQNGLYGYCDKSLNVKVKAFFEKAGLFEAVNSSIRYLLAIAVTSIRKSMSA
ncbi:MULTISPECIES: hypothetical protein [Sphingobacterium]|uniref:hypothetical protein n=1 Tax=Sphingobacterium TaxID=28453 RepID=UPI000EC050DF|nr:MULTISPECIES: hypothetical protein [Sphingobacterium]HAK29089.1 hypothetical protein [Sphingobacterium sp.]HCX56259.1 hypothetical protein [Sphingobacterium sp.]